MRAEGQTSLSALPGFLDTSPMAEASWNWAWLFSRSSGPRDLRQRTQQVSYIRRKSAPGLWERWGIAVPSLLDLSRPSLAQARAITATHPRQLGISQGRLGRRNSALLPAASYQDRVSSGPHLLPQSPQNLHTSVCRVRGPANWMCSLVKVLGGYPRTSDSPKGPPASPFCRGSSPKPFHVTEERGTVLMALSK